MVATSTKGVMAARLERSSSAKALEAAAATGFRFNIDFDNQSDPDATVITISGPDRSDLLMELTGAFRSLDLLVAAANIRRTEDGQVLDVFRITDSKEAKISEDSFEVIREQLLKVVSRTSKSSKPAIYGVAAAAELKRLRPLDKASIEARLLCGCAPLQAAHMNLLPPSLQGDTTTLEAAAAEMSSAAATLVALEREIYELSQNGV